MSLARPVLAAAPVGAVGTPGAGAPVSGTVTEVNKPLADNLEWLQQEPYGKAWMIKLKLSNPAEVNALLDAAAYAAHCESESH